MEQEAKKSMNFIEQIIEEDLKNGKNNSEVYTRFPPEPNGYLHIGHAKSICLNFGLGKQFGGKTNLRFDDTNPAKEDIEYVDSIQDDVRWLGFEWEGEPRYASDYFEQIYQMAVNLIVEGKAYVCDLSAEDISKYRGTPTRPGTFSPFRDRTVEENLDLFDRMRQGEFKDSEKMLRAKTGMDSPNMHMRDPIMYRIRHVEHDRTGSDWCIYPTYDYAHGQSDYIEGITHSVCTLEFENHKPLYNWFLDQVYTGGNRPQQIEFARLNLSYTIMSKRKLLQLVEEGHVNSWDDPRMPTISGYRRRGYTAASIRNFADKIGVAKRDNVIDVALLEHSIREDLNKTTRRLMGVMDPLKVTITNYEQVEEYLTAVNNPEDESMGTREVPFSKHLLIEKADYMDDAPKKFFRLSQGREVRLRYAYFITCNEVIKDENGNVIELLCTYDPESKGGKSPDGRKVKGTLHWVSEPHAIDAEIRNYDRLFTKETPEENGEDFLDNINANSLEVITAKVEPYVQNADSEDKFQFERIGYFCADRYDHSKEKLVFNRTITLRDNWSKKK